jgi:hypothetical protein
VLFENCSIQSTYKSSKYFKSLCCKGIECTVICNRPSIIHVITYFIGYKVHLFFIFLG